VWIALVGITSIYLLVDHSTDKRVLVVASTTVTVSAIVLALVKFRVIMREFMDVRHASPALGRVTDILVLVIAVSFFGTYLVGRLVA
jgi:hypothetical protein